MWQDRQTLTHDRLSAHRCPLARRHFCCYRIQLATSFLPLFSFMEKYDPAWSPNGGDSALRYTFQKQPDISAWNCERLSEAFSSLVGERRESKVVRVEGQNFLAMLCLLATVTQFPLTWKTPKNTGALGMAIKRLCELATAA